MDLEDDDDFLFPWEKGAPPAKPPINFGEVSNPEPDVAKAKPRPKRRSSILKVPAPDVGADRAALKVR